MKTLFLGSYGFGNLGDELCLLDATRAFPSSEVWSFSANPEYSARTTGFQNFIQNREQARELKPQRVVLGGGGVGFWPSLRDALHWMHDALSWGAELHIYNIGVGEFRNPEWDCDLVVRNVLAKLSSFSVRDEFSRLIVRSWGYDLDPKLSFFPEKSIEMEEFDFFDIPSNTIGISITGQIAMRQALKENVERINLMLSSFDSRNVLPIVSTYQGQNIEENDMFGFEYFEKFFLKDYHIVSRKPLDPKWWNDSLNPRRLKFLISKLDLLISQRKHNIVHAIGVGVPFVAVSPVQDESLARVVYSLRSELPWGTRILSLPTERKW